MDALPGDRLFKSSAYFCLGAEQVLGDQPISCEVSRLVLAITA